jgi:hypothetical protein
LTNHHAAAERLADEAHRLTWGDSNNSAVGTSLATEALVHAVLALVTEIRDWRGDQRIDQPAPRYYRAEYDGIGIGVYTTREVAREHCSTLARQEGLRNLAWVTEDGEDVDDLHDAENAQETGYSVTPVDVDETYDPDSDDKE